MSATNLDTDAINVELFNKLATGDTNAFHSLFNSFNKRFYGATFRLTGSHYLAEEAVQETFIRVWNKREKFRGLENPVGYLHILFYRCLSQRFRKEARLRQLEGSVLEMPMQDDLTKEEIATLEKKYRLLQIAVDNLPPQQAQIFRLIKEQGYSREQAAAHLKISPNTVRNHLAAAIQTLKKSARTITSVVIFIMQWLIK